MAPAHQEVFILDITRADGTRFVTSVGTVGGVGEARRRHKAVDGAVSHWKRDGAQFHYTNIASAADWRLNERFAL